jgi:hypothetical protein
MCWPKFDIYHRQKFDGICFILINFRANLYGWPNTYVFTKAMGEMLVGTMKEKISTVIVRPTIITSTYKEPFPGWVEGVR